MNQDKNVTSVLRDYVYRTALPAWCVLDALSKQGFSEYAVLTAMLLQVQDHDICVDYRGRLCIPSTGLGHDQEEY